MGSGEMISAKLDENLGNRGKRFLIDQGHDVSTVWEQDLATACDSALIEVCRAEGRCLVTLDMDFSNPLRYPPKRFAGIVVLRPPKNPCFQDLMDCLKTLAQGLAKCKEIKGKLWVVGPRQIREYIPTEA